MSRIKQVATWWATEQHRHFLVYSACFAGGMALYFALPFEPNLWALTGVACLLTLLAAGCWSRLPWRGGALALCLLALGAAWASGSAHHQRGIVLAHAMNPRPVQGTVRAIERTDEGMRITLSNVVISGVDVARTPARIRLSLRLKDEAAPPEIGQRLSIMAGLLPPMGPAMPHGFDFARYFYFHGIGAVGYGLPPWQSEPKTQASVADSFQDWRVRMTDRIIAALGPSHGPIAAGLITGEARAMQQADYEALKASNLYHIIAISGGHMVVVSGMIFLLLRWLTLLLPARLRYRPAMKPVAAAGALILVTGYLLVTGMPPSATRAYIMIALVLLSVILRRQVNPMRSLVITALLMLLWNPANLLDPGFQLSFAATMAIVALVERMFLAPSPEEGRLRLMWKVILASFLISLVAEAATAPLVIAQFNQFGFYGVPANLIATPLVDFLMMPLVAIYFLLLPLGLAAYALAALNGAIALLLGLAHAVAALPGALHYLPSPPGWGEACFVLGLLWFCFFLRRPRWLGVPLMLIGVASIATITPPDVLVGPELKQIAIRSESGYLLPRGKPDALLPQLWANGLGYQALPRPSRDDAAWRCDRLGCVAQVNGTRIAFPQNPAALLQDCTQAPLVITNLRRIHCARARVIDGWDLWHGGAQSIWLAPLRIETSAGWQGRRLWSIHP